MADRFNPLLSPRHADLVRRLLGEESVLHTISPEIGLYYPLAAGPEELWEQGIFLWSSGPQTVAAAVGKVGRLQIQNPAGSRRLVVVTRFDVDAVALSASAEFWVTVDGAAIGAGLTQNFALDLRVPLPAAGSRQVSSINAIDNSLAAKSGTLVGRFTVLTTQDNAPYNLPPIILPPGTVCECTDNTQNQTIVLTAFGYERVARPEEIS